MHVIRRSYVIRNRVGSIFLIFILIVGFSSNPIIFQKSGKHLDSITTYLSSKSIGLEGIAFAELGNSENQSENEIQSTEAGNAAVNESASVNDKEKTSGENQEYHNATISSNATVSEENKNENQTEYNNLPFNEENNTNHEEYKDSFQAYAEENADSEHEITLTLSKYLYQPGDEVELKGSVFSDIITKLNETDKVVSIKIINEEDQVVAENNDIRLDNNGNFEVSIPLPENVTAGDYEAKATLSANTNATGLEETSNEVQLEADASFTVVTKPIPFDIKTEGEDFNVQVATNSTVDNVQLEQSQKKVNVVVEGKNGTRGVADIEIPKNMLSGTITVTIDGVETKNFKIVKETDTLLIVEVSYHHSKHTISIQGTSVVPEFSVVLLVLVMAIIPIIVFSRKATSWNQN